MLTEYALDLLRKDLKSRIAYAKYTAGGNEYKADAQSREILTDGRVAVGFVIGHESGAADVTAVELYDHNDKLLARKEEHIVRRDAQEGVLYHFRFTIDER